YVGVDFENEGHPHDNEQIDVFYDGKTLPFQSEMFDSALCTEVFEHIFNLEEILNEINRVMKHGGKMIVNCPFVWNEHEVQHDFDRYTKFALESMLKKAGFEVVEYSKSGDFISTITQLITLYFFNAFKGWWRKVFIFRWIYKALFFLIPNLTGIILQRI